ncbi:hypothetical protein ACFSTC_00180 [Nonomuraea ferruginea]
MTTLTDRYVAEALRGIPEGQRRDIELELRSSIADAVEVRLRTGEDESRAEVEALAALGDPARLAAEYAGWPLHLIGPALYLSYTRLLKTLLTTAVPLVFLGASVVGFARGGPAGRALWEATGTALTVAMHVAFWVTLVFAAVQRAPSMRDRRLSPVGSGHTARAARAADRPHVADRRHLGRDGPDLPAGAGPALRAGPGDLAGAVGVRLAVPGGGVRRRTDRLRPGRLLRGLGRPPQAVAHAVMGLAFVVLGVWVTAGGALLNDAFLEAMGWPEGVVTWVVVIVVVLMAVNDSINGFVRARRRKA